MPVVTELTPAEQAPHRWLTLGLLAAALVLSMSPWFSATAVLPQLRQLYGFSDSFAAWLTISVQLGFVVGAVGSSSLGIADRFAARHVIIWAALLTALCNGLLLFADTPAQWLWLRLATGAFLAGVYPPALKLIATWFQRGRGLALGVLIGALTLGSASPHLINATGGAQWMQVIGLTSATTVLGAIIVALGVREGPFPFPVSVFRPRDMVLAMRNRGVRLATVGYFGHMWELYAMWAWFATYARHALDAQHSALDASLVTFLVIGIGVLGCVLGGLFADRYGRARVAALAMAISAVCCVLVPMAFQGPLWLFLGLSAIWGISVVADSAQFSAIVSEMGEPRLVGTALTLQLGLGFVLTAVTIWLLPILAAHWGSWQWTVLTLAPGPLLGIVAMRQLWR